jgi:hypothetical protein
LLEDNGGHSFCELSFGFATPSNFAVNEDTTFQPEPIKSPQFKGKYLQWRMFMRTSPPCIHTTLFFNGPNCGDLPLVAKESDPSLRRIKVAMASSHAHFCLSIFSRIKTTKSSLEL